MTVFLFVLIIVLLMMSGIFSGSETAFATANKVRLKKAVENGSRAAAVAQYIVDNFTRSLSTILIGNNLVNIAASSAVTVLAITLFPDRQGEAQAYGGVILTVALLIFGEVMPKIIASEYADTIILLTCRLIRFFMVLFYPIVRVVTALVGKLEKLWTPADDDTPSVTQNELLTLVDTIEDEGVFTEKEGELIKNAIEFADATAREIMVPRVDVEAFDITDGIGGLSRNKQLLKYSRIPVYRETMDDIIGILPAKKFMRETVRNGDGALTESQFTVLLTEPVYVHMTRPISSILNEFTRTHSHMAVVVDEFGGTMGILTLEDILEEIVGEIYDEHDEVERDVISADENDGVYVVDASMNIYDMFELCGINPEAVGFDSEYTTVGGFTTEILNRFPKEGDMFEFGGLRFEVTRAKPMRVEELKITKAEPDEDDGE